MFEQIKRCINKRMSQYSHSVHPTADEVRIAWLVMEIERLRKDR